jgi:nucleotide-binding universal stress UspA family protein
MTMTSLQRIVAATDSSAPARHAVERAAQIAQATGAQLTVLHGIGGSAIDDIQRWISTGDVEREFSHKAMQDLQAFADRLRQEHGISVDARVGTGHPVEEVAALADELRADLIVCGSRGSALGRRLVGSVAERVVRTALRPVLLVRRAPRLAYTRLLIPVDFSFWSESSIHIARRVAPRAHVVLMHAIDTTLIDRMRLDGVDKGRIEQCRDAARNEARELLADLAGRAGLAPGDWTESITVGTEPWTAIVQQEQEHDCDLIVIGKQGRSALGEFLLGSVTRMVIAESESDVLIAARGETIVLRSRDRR